MLKQVSVTFNFDPETEFVSDLQCFVNGVEKKKTTTRKATKKEVVLEDEALVIREDNKIILNNRAVSEMEVSAEDRMIIKYIKFNKSKKLTPVIGSDSAFDEEGNGNKVTKSYTIAYRGNANKILAEYGSTFNIEAVGDGTWKLISKDKESVDNYEAIVDDIKEEDITVFTEDDQDTTINEMTFIL